MTSGLQWARPALVDKRQTRSPCSPREDSINNIERDGVDVVIRYSHNHTQCHAAADHQMITVRSDTLPVPTFKQMRSLAFRRASSCCLVRQRGVWWPAPPLVGPLTARGGAAAAQLQQLVSGGGSAPGSFGRQLQPRASSSAQAVSSDAVGVGKRCATARTPPSCWQTSFLAASLSQTCHPVLPSCKTSLPQVVRTGPHATGVPLPTPPATSSSSCSRSRSGSRPDAATRAGSGDGSDAGSACLDACG